MSDTQAPNEHWTTPRMVRKEWYESPGDDKNTNTQFVEDVADVTKELFDLLISKHHDYGPKNISESPGGAMNGLRVRLWDKLARLNNLVDAGIHPQHESLEDTFKDMANYAIIGLLVLRKKWDN